MSRAEIKIRWAIALTISAVLVIILIALLPRLPSFSELNEQDGEVDTSTVDNRVEAGGSQTVFVVTLDGSPGETFVVMKGADAGFYRATQTVASGDDVILWTYPIGGTQDLRIWQLSDRGQLIVNYNEVYGVEKKWHNQLIGGIIVFIVIINALNALIIKTMNSEPPPLPRMLEFGD